MGIRKSNHLCGRKTLVPCKDRPTCKRLGGKANGCVPKHDIRFEPWLKRVEEEIKQETESARIPYVPGNFAKDLSVYLCPG